MKNKYLTKCFCITLFSAMVVSSSMAVCAAGEPEAFVSEDMVQEAAEPVVTPAPQIAAEIVPAVIENTETVKESTPVPEETVQPKEPAQPEVTLPPAQPEAGTTPEPEVSPTPTPGEEEAPEVSPTPTPGEGEQPEVSPTPTPGEGEEPEVSPTPTPGEGEQPEVSPTPTPGEGEQPEVSPTPTPGEGEQPEVSPTPTPGEGEQPEVSPTPTPGEGEQPEVSPTPTPGEGEQPEVGPTPTPGEGEQPEVSPTPTPGEGEQPEVSPTPVPDETVDSAKAESLVKRLNKLLLGSLTADDEELIKSLRKEYEELTEAEKKLVENYHLLVSYEAKIEELKAEESDDFGSTLSPNTGITIPTTILTSRPVYYTSMVSNLHAGKEFYLDSLKNNYQITFSEDFASVMAEIEREHKKKYKVTDNCDKRADGLTSSADTLLARNWQDVIAIYIYEKSKEGYTEFHLSSLCKEDLARIFEELNPIVRDKDDITRVTYGNRHINYYIKENSISGEDREMLKKYVENDCKLLCATVTGGKGFVRQSVGDHVSEERVNVITAAYSLVGKVGYFWGGKSNSVGENPNWGTAEFVSSPGSNSTGTLRAYGLDCSGFVSWAVINGYQSKSMVSSIGEGTTAQWLNAQVISEAEAQPGDLVFQRGPEAGENNHVGILCGQTEAGDWIAIHCSSSKNGVTVGEAYGASFRYIRQPSVYPSDQQVAELESLYGYKNTGTNDVFINDNLSQLISQTGIGSGNVEFQSELKNTSANMFTDVADVVVFDDSPITMNGIAEFVVE